jgi:hypothetical protein
MPSSGMLHRMALLRTYVSVDASASINRVTRIGELGTTLALASIFLRSVRRLLVTAIVVPSSPILVALMTEALESSDTSVLQDPHDVTSQKTWFITFISNTYASYMHILTYLHIITFQHKLTYMQGSFRTGLCYRRTSSEVDVASHISSCIFLT